jgi:hypothetical protein
MEILDAGGQPFEHPENGQPVMMEATVEIGRPPGTGSPAVRDRVLVPHRGGRSSVHPIEGTSFAGVLPFHIAGHVLTSIQSFKEVVS